MKVGMLSILAGVDQGKTFLLKNLSVFEGGRSQGNHVLIKDPSVAMSHFRICRQGDGYMIYDLGARSGTKVNGTLVEKIVLQDGDTVKVGDVVIKFEMVDADTPGRLASCAPEFDEPGLSSDTAIADVQLADSSSGFEDARAVIERELAPPALEVVEGEEKGKIFELVGKESFSIGRSTNVDLRLRDSKISRLHCRVEQVRDHFVVADNGSSNGTVVNGERVNKTVLKDGDYIRLGFTILRFRKGAPLAAGVELSV